MNEAIATPPTNVARHFPHIPQEIVPLGLETLYAALLKLYPSQRNPLQVVAMTKIWMGGPDPLDYISMYSNPGNSERSIPPHWHYVSMGLSDLHGDGRVHPTRDHTQPSGYGYELTFRLKKTDEDIYPPTWPAGMLQQLARSVATGSKFYVGDSVPWHLPLDGDGNSRIRHILLADDLQLPPIVSPFGSISFIQVVGVCDEELKASQRWNGRGLLDLLRAHASTGGDLLVTDLRRRSTVFELDLKARDTLDRGVATEGSTLIGVPARLSWTEWRNLAPNEWQTIPTDCRITKNPDPNSVIPYKGVEISLNFEAALMLPLMLQSRLAHERHFSFTNYAQNGGVTFAPPNVAAMVNPSCPYACWNNWLQVYVGPELRTIMQIDLAELDEIDIENRLTLPKCYEWRNYCLKIVIMPEQT